MVPVTASEGQARGEIRNFCQGEPRKDKSCCAKERQTIGPQEKGCRKTRLLKLRPPQARGKDKEESRGRSYGFEKGRRRKAGQRENLELDRNKDHPLDMKAPILTKNGWDKAKRKTKKELYEKTKKEQLGRVRKGQGKGES